MADDDGDIIYTSRNEPLKYEDQTRCISITTEHAQDMEIILDKLLPKTNQNQTNEKK